MWADSDTAALAPAGPGRVPQSLWVGGGGGWPQHLCRTGSQDTSKKLSFHLRAGACWGIALHQPPEHQAAAVASWKQKRPSQRFPCPAAVARCHFSQRRAI